MEALFPAARGDCSAMFWRRRAEARLGLHMIRLHLAVDPPARVPAAQSGAATPRVTSIKGKNITVLLAGLESNASNAVGTWRADCSPRTAFTYPAVVVPVQTAINARVYAPWRYAPVTVCSVEFELRPTRGVAALCADKIAFDRG